MSILNLSLPYGSYVGVFHFFPHDLKVGQPYYTRREATAFGDTRALSRIDRILSTYLWMRHVISTAQHMLTRTSEELFLVTTQQYAPSSETYSSRTPEPAYSQLYVEILSCSHFMMSKDSLLHGFCALAQFKILQHKAQKLTQRELSRETRDCVEAKLVITSTASRACRN